MTILKIISGGQTGVDRMGLEVARELGLPTGGTAHKGYWTEYGEDPSLADFGLIEHPSGAYTNRTMQNVFNAHGTAIYGDIASSGSKTTIQYCHNAGKPCIMNPTPVQLINFIREHRIQVLNVAGNRSSKLTPELLDAYRSDLRQGLRPFSNLTIP